MGSAGVPLLLLLLLLLVGSLCRIAGSERGKEPPGGIFWERQPCGVGHWCQRKALELLLLGQIGAFLPHPQGWDIEGLGGGLSQPPSSPPGGPIRKVEGAKKAPLDPPPNGPSRGHPSASVAGLRPPPPRVGPPSSRGCERWAWDSLLTALLLLLLLLLLFLAAHFLFQFKSECHFLNGTQRVRYLYRHFYDWQETDLFDSDLGKFVAVTELGQPDADPWNSNKVYMQYLRAAVDRFCRHNYGVYNYQAAKTRPKPTITISPTKADPADPNTILLCTATGFYPLEIDIRWLKNGRPEKEGVAFGEELQNGDWTYQRQVMLETRPQRGDVYACQVGHASLEAPITVQWEPRSSHSARSKLWTGAVGAMLGVAFLAVGLSLYLKSKKALMS
ncbi:H-2 class II histocompatibility antigen, E-S beta chain-like [Candoia aspera]|uniref:H-2 class II histocompatibility antigen, E-S beta chain-like n=1 Tax=Candoia aspera TaxID=51853 RepID=UPI002FD8618E